MTVELEGATIGTTRITTRWRSWLGLWIFTGLSAALSEWYLLGNPGVHGAIAAIAGAAAAGLTFHLVRGGDWRVEGAFILTGPALFGAKGGSEIEAIAGGVIFGILMGLIVRPLDRAFRESKATGPKPILPQPTDREEPTTGTLGPWNGE